MLAIPAQPEIRYLHVVRLAQEVGVALTGYAVGKCLSGMAALEAVGIRADRRVVDGFNQADAAPAAGHDGMTPAAPATPAHAGLKPTRFDQYDRCRRR